MRAARGERLYALVEAYAGLGDHRTGTPVDDATREWFAEEIERRGGVVEHLPYDFERYVADAHVTVGARELPIVPLFYSGLGEVDSTEPYIAEIDPTVGGSHADDALAVARAMGFRAAVLTTRGPAGRLVGINRTPSTPPGPIAVLAPGDMIDALRQGPVRVTVDARVAPGSSATVVGHFAMQGRVRGHPVVVTTPLTGWFGCAGERGTGIAVALELAQELAAARPVLLVATTGHEIGFLGMHDYLARSEEADACAVLHMGASVAATDGTGGERRVALVDGADHGLDESLDTALGPSGFRTLRHEGPWPTEGDGWRHRGIPVVSYVGFFDRFHTPDDVPEAVTNPAYLDTVAGALLEAARLVIP